MPPWHLHVSLGTSPEVPLSPTHRPADRHDQRDLVASRHQPPRRLGLGGVPLSTASLRPAVGALPRPLRRQRPERCRARAVPVPPDRARRGRPPAPLTARSTSALHLTHQANLDALGLDDRVNTGRLDRPLPGGSDPLLAVCQNLSDAVYDWWDGSPPPLVYRTRSVPRARSMAFTDACTWQRVRSRRLREATALLVDLVAFHGFDVPPAWL